MSQGGMKATAAAPALYKDAMPHAHPGRSPLQDPRQWHSVYDCGISHIGME